MAILPKLSKLQVASTMGLVALPLYFFLLHKGRYKRITKEFGNETQEQRRTRGILVCGYIVLSWVLIVITAIIREKMLKS